MVSGSIVQALCDILGLYFGSDGKSPFLTSANHHETFLTTA